jgi:hypothetical protein
VANRPDDYHHDERLAAEEHAPEWGCVYPSTEWYKRDMVDTIPRTAAYWCDVHERPLTYEEARWAPEYPGQPRCSWCREPGLLTGEVPYKNIRRLKERAEH